METIIKHIHVDSIRVIGPLEREKKYYHST